jgi:tRNA(His) 5'-end guanylyltransferase
MIGAMTCAAKAVAREMQGFKLGYVQSDEASFVLTDYDSVGTQPWLGYVQNKIESLTASLMSVYFNRYLNAHFGEEYYAVFDARAFNIPESEVANYLLWRAKDWERNSIQMLAQSVLPHRDLQGLNRRCQLDALVKTGNTWDYQLPVEKYGTFLVGTDLQKLHVPAHYVGISKMWESVRPLDNG